MKIAYIGSFNRLYDEDGIAKSLERLGHEVIRLEEYKITKLDLYNIFKIRPDFVLMAKLKIALKYRNWFISECKKIGIKTVCWMPDLYWGTSRETKLKGKIDAIFRSDIVCSPDGGNDNKWKKIKVNHKLLRQGIYDKECYIGKHKNRNDDIVFIGCDNPIFRYRILTMQRLRQKYGDDFTWLGKQDTHQYRGQNLNNLFASVKIVMGDSVYSPNYWSNRIYETIGRGGFLIHPNIEGLDKEFIPYKHFVPYDYDNYDSLYQKIDYYLTHNDERKKIVKAGMLYVLDNHTLINRCKQLIEYVK